MIVTDDWDVTTEAGFMACYGAMFAPVYRYAGTLCGRDRAAAEDLVHDVFLNALARARRGELRSVSVGYLTTAVRHRWIDRWRAEEREHRRVAMVQSIAPEVPGSAALPPVMLAALPDRERTAVVLRYIDDLPVAKVASEMGIGTRAAESLLARALRRLRREEVADV
jgi:DNA-directed RNA polymerase specialized sigma24 family protein